MYGMYRACHTAPEWTAGETARAAAAATPSAAVAQAVA
jgi:hypothetical protein